MKYCGWNSWKNVCSKSLLEASIFFSRTLSVYFFQQTDYNRIFLKKSMHTYRKIFSNYAYFSAKLFTHSWKIFSNYAYFSAKLFTHSWKGLVFYHKPMHLHLITIEKLILMAYGNSSQKQYLDLTSGLIQVYSELATKQRFHSCHNLCKLKPF